MLWNSILIYFFVGFTLILLIYAICSRDIDDLFLLVSLGIMCTLLISLIVIYILKNYINIIFAISAIVAIVALMIVVIIRYVKY